MRSVFLFLIGFGCASINPGSSYGAVVEATADSHPNVRSAITDASGASHSGHIAKTSRLRPATNGLRVPMRGPVRAGVSDLVNLGGPSQVNRNTAAVSGKSSPTAPTTAVLNGTEMGHR